MSPARATRGELRGHRDPGRFLGWVRHPRTPSRAPALHPGAATAPPPQPPGLRGIPELWVQGPRLRVREVAGLGSAPGKVWTWKSPLRPTGEGARDGRACAVAPEPAPRPPLPGPCALPARSLPGGDRLASRGRRALLPRGAAGLHPGPLASGRQRATGSRPGPAPASAWRSRGRAGARWGAAAASARVCGGARERGSVRV